MDFEGSGEEDKFDLPMKRMYILSQKLKEELKRLNKTFTPLLIPKKFYLRDPSLVAIDLLGKFLVRYINNKPVGGMIVETEAYYGINDPASKAYCGRQTKISRMMYEEGGTTLIYMVHGNWLFNIITGKRDEPSGVLIRAVEPLIGLNYMTKNRKKDNVINLTNGPGKLCKALNIDKSLNGLKVYMPNSPVQIYYYIDIPRENIVAAHRIGVKRDLPIPLRFYIRNNLYVSKR